MGIAIRQTPDLNSAITGTINVGEFIDVIDEKVLEDGTRRVKLADGRGWITYLRKGIESFIESFRPLKKCKVISSLQLRIREEVSLLSKETGFLKNGEVVDICEEIALPNRIVRTKLADGRGWISFNDLKGNKNIEVTEDYFGNSTDEKKGSSTAQIFYETPDSKVNRNIYYQKKPKEKDRKSNVVKYKVTSSLPLSVFRSVQGDSDVLFKLVKGSVVSVIQNSTVCIDGSLRMLITNHPDGNGWVTISTNGMEYMELIGDDENNSYIVRL